MATPNEMQTAEQQLLTRRGRNLVKANTHASSGVNGIEETLNQLRAAFGILIPTGALNPVSGVGYATGVATPEMLQQLRDWENRIYNFPLYKSELWKTRHDAAYNYLKNKLATEGRLNELPPYLTEKEVEAIEKERAAKQEPELWSVSDQEWEWFQRQQQPTTLERISQAVDELYWNPVTRPIGGLAKLGGKIFDTVFGGTKGLLERLEGAKPVRAADVFWTTLEVVPPAKGLTDVGLKAARLGVRAGLKEAERKATEIALHKAAIKGIRSVGGYSNIGNDAVRFAYTNLKDPNVLKLRDLMGKARISKGDMIDLLVPDLRDYGVKVTGATTIVGLRKVGTLKNAPIRVMDDADAAKLASKLIGRHAQENNVLIIVDDTTGKVEGVVRLALGGNTSVMSNPAYLAHIITSWPGMGKQPKTIYSFHNHPGSVGMPSEGDVTSMRATAEILARWFQGSMNKLPSYNETVVYNYGPPKKMRAKINYKEGVVDPFGRYSMFDLDTTDTSFPWDMEEYTKATEAVGKSRAPRGEVPVLERRIVKAPLAENFLATARSVPPIASADNVLAFLKKNDILDKPGIIVFGAGSEPQAWIPIENFEGTNFIPSDNVKKALEAVAATFGTVHPSSVMIWAGRQSNFKDIKNLFKDLDLWELPKGVEDMLDIVKSSGPLSTNLGAIKVGAYDPRTKEMVLSFLNRVDKKHYELDSPPFKLTVYDYLDRLLNKSNKEVGIRGRNLARRAKKKKGGG